jgi:hypothetical protein
MPSKIPAAYAAVLASLRANLPGVTVIDGPGATDMADNHYVMVGVSDSDSDGYVEAITGHQKWAQLGGRFRDETFTIHCSAVGWNGDGDQTQAGQPGRLGARAVRRRVPHPHLTESPSLASQTAGPFPCPEGVPVAQFRNVSGVDRHLALPDWLAPRLVEADAEIEVEDDLAAKYDFNQPGVWESLDAPKPSSKNGSN